MVGKMMILDEPTFRAFLNSQKIEWMSRLVLIIVGLGYGAISIASNASYILSFESSLLKYAVVPGIFLVFGLLTALLTKVGFALLLWAAARGLGGKGRLKQVNIVTPVSLLPGLLSVPYLVGAGNGSGMVVILLVVGVLWMYLISVKIVQSTQSFNGKKAYLAGLLAFVFLASIYYLVVPNGSIA